MYVSFITMCVKKSKSNQPNMGIFCIIRRLSYTLLSYGISSCLTHSNRIKSSPNRIPTPLQFGPTQCILNKCLPCVIDLVVYLVAHHNTRCQITPHHPLPS